MTISPSTHVSHWGSWMGSILAVHGATIGNAFQQNLGAAIAVCFSLASAFVYGRLILFSGELKKEAAKERFRREQELLELEHKARLAAITAVLSPTKVSE